MKNIEEFEQLFKDQSQSATSSPPAGAWEGISSGIKSAASASSSTGFISSVSGLIKTALFVGGTLATIGILYQANKPAKKDLESSIDTTSTIKQDNSSAPVVNNDKEIHFTDVKDKKQDKTPVKNEVKQKSDASINNGTNSTSGSDEGANSTPPETSSVPASVKDDIQSTSLRLNASNFKPCLGEIIELSNTSNTAGNWFVNGKKIAANTNATNYKCVEKKDINITFKSGDRELVQKIYVSSLEASIHRIEQEDGSYEFSLSNIGLISNWYIDDKLISTNSKKINYNFQEVGKHQIKAVPVNHTCSGELFDEITIKPTGKIEIDNIFTPNGDGINDFYQVRIENYTNFSLQILTNKLVKVFATNNPEIGWNGLINNTENECAEGEYFAVISYQLKGEKPVTKNIRLVLTRNNNN